MALYGGHIDYSESGGDVILWRGRSYFAITNLNRRGLFPFLLSSHGSRIIVRLDFAQCENAWCGLVAGIISLTVRSCTLLRCRRRHALLLFLVAGHHRRSLLHQRFPRLQQHGFLFVRVAVTSHLAAACLRLLIRQRDHDLAGGVARPFAQRVVDLDEDLLLLMIDGEAEHAQDLEVTLVGHLIVKQLQDGVMQHLGDVLTIRFLQHGPFHKNAGTGPF